MFITSSAVVRLWRTHTATHPGQSLAHPAQVCPSHNGDINMTTEQNNDATRTNELDQETIDEIRRIVRKHIVATMITVEDDGNWVIDMVTEGDA